LLRSVGAGVKADPAGAAATAGVAVPESSIRRACQVVAFDLFCAGLRADDEGVGENDGARRWTTSGHGSPGSCTCEGVVTFRARRLAAREGPSARPAPFGDG